MSQIILESDKRLYPRLRNSLLVYALNATKYDKIT